MTYYDILGVPQTASKEEIKQAYRKLAQDYHPDKLAGIPPAVAKLAEEKFKDVQEAYETLTKHRAEYDNQLRAVSPPPSPPSQPRTRTAASPPPPATQSRPVRKNKNNLWYKCRKFAGELPWHAWALFGVVWVFCIAAMLAPSNTPETPKQASATTAAAKNGNEGKKPVKWNGKEWIDVATGKPIPAAVAPSAPATEGSAAWNADQPQSSTFASKQKAADNKTVTPTLIDPSAKFTGQFGGIVHNQSANASAEFGIVVQDAGGILSGCMGVKQPLFGSGPLSGRASGADVSFVVTSAIGKITFIGQRRVDTVSGTYRVEHESSPIELGTFTLGKVKSGEPGSDFDGQNCPTDAEVHQRQTTKNNSLIPNPLPSRPIVGQAEKAREVAASDTKLTAAVEALVAEVHELAAAEGLPKSEEQKCSEEIAQRISNSSAMLDRLERGEVTDVQSLFRDLCNTSSNKTATPSPLLSPTEVEEPKPTPKYVALGYISCYVNQRVMVYTDEILAKQSGSLEPGQGIYKVGVMGESVGLRSNAIDAKPAYWLDGKEIGKLTCTR